MKLSDAVQRAHLPERTVQLGSSARAADRLVAAGVGPDVLDTTHFDTVRFPPPPWAADAFAAAASDGSSAYTAYRGAASVRERLADSLTRRLGADVHPDRQLLVTPGTQAGLFAVLGAPVSPGDTVALFDPDYLFSERIVRFLGAEVRRVPLAGDGADLVPDLDELARVLRGGASVVLFSHPNNPTGAVYSNEVVAAIAALVRDHDAFAVVDELYARLVYGGRQLPHLVAEPGMHDRCATLMGPSKTESLSGYRVGVVTAPASVVDAAEDVLAAMALRAPAYAQHLLKHWLRDDEEFVATRLTELEALRDHTVARLRETATVRVASPPATAYVFVDASALPLPGHLLAEHLVREARVLVSPGYQFGPRGVGSFRLCYARDEQEWDMALTRLNAALQSASRS